MIVSETKSTNTVGTKLQQQREVIQMRALSSKSPKTENEITFRRYKPCPIYGDIRCSKTGGKD